MKQAERRVKAAAERRLLIKREGAIQLAEAIRRAQDDGVSVTRIAELAGFSRQAVYDLLRRNER